MCERKGRVTKGERCQRDRAPTRVVDHHARRGDHAPRASIESPRRHHVGARLDRRVRTSRTEQITYSCNACRFCKGCRGARAPVSGERARRLGRRRRLERGVAVQNGVSTRVRRRRVDDRLQEWNTPTRTVDGILACWDCDVPARVAATLSDAEADQRQGLNERVAPEVQESTWRVGRDTDARMRQRSVERKSGRPLEGREQPFGISQDEELKDLSTGAPGERFLQPEQTDADDFGPACVGIPGFGQEIEERIKPFISSRVETHRVNATPMALVKGVWRRLRCTFRRGGHNGIFSVMLLAGAASSHINTVDYCDADRGRFSQEIKGFLHTISRSGR